MNQRIAHIAPARRMPKTLGHLSYIVPTALEKNLQIGQLVTIPLRNNTVFGIVLGITEEEISTEALAQYKEVESIIQDTPLFSETMLHSAKQLVHLYNISYGTAIKLFLPPLQKRKLKQVTYDAWPKERPATTKASKTHYVYESNAEIRKETFAALRAGTLLIVPEVTHIEKILEEIQALHPNKEILIWHSGLSPKKQFDAWFAVHNGTPDIIIGTRTALFLPFRTLSHILLYKEHHTNHKHWEGTPRYAVKDLIPLWKQAYGATATYLSYSPSFDSYYHIAKGNIDSAPETLSSLHTPQSHHITLCDMGDEKKAGNMEMLAEQVQECIAKEKSGDIIILINRKGFATALHCHECGYTSRCESCGQPHIYYKKNNTIRCHYCKTAAPLPHVCPKCTQGMLTLYGAGTERVESFIKKKFGKALPHTILRIDGNQDDSTQLAEINGPTICIGTARMLSRVRWNRVSHLIYLDIDAELHYPDYRALEDVWHTLQDIIHQIPTSGHIYIQTYHKDHLLFKGLHEPERLYRQDLSMRQSFSFPPYTTLVRLSTKARNGYAGEKEAERVYSMLSKRLTNQDISATVTYPIATYPQYYRGNYWYTILLKIEPHEWYHTLARLIHDLPSDWRVDPSPQSLLSP